MKISTLILTILVCFSTIVDAQGTQNRANELMKQAQSSLEQKEYTKARYLFIQAYGAFATPSYNTIHSCFYRISKG